VLQGCRRVHRFDKLFRRGVLEHVTRRPRLILVLSMQVLVLLADGKTYERIAANSM
jgi:hypothetical protein